MVARPFPDKDDWVFVAKSRDGAPCLLRVAGTAGGSHVMSVKIERILPKNGDVFTCISGAASVFVASRNLTLVISASPVAGEVREIRNDPHSLAILSLRHGPETLAAQNGGDWKFHEQWAGASSKVPTGHSRSSRK